MVAVPISRVAAFAVPLLPARGQSSVEAPDAPVLRHPEDSGAFSEARRFDLFKGKRRSKNQTIGRHAGVALATTTRTEFEAILTTSTVTPTISVTATPPPTTTASPVHACDLRYCDAGTSYCEYWGGYSSFDVSHGRPIPGETRTPIGVCTGITPVTETLGNVSPLSSTSSSIRSNNSSAPASTASVKATSSTSHSSIVTLTCMAVRE
ncbi:hypothetical protein SEPCBS119000_001177 [Sporothrix epigloea]|uniref:Uncharacterized protein n=1 Tax=Sporothrix epigloea TaxID=1892477 RepID=A0ABP0DAX8_9PEZI